MPADITTFARAKSRQPAPVKELLGRSDPASQERVRSAVAEVAEKLGWLDRPPRGGPG